MIGTGRGQLVGGPAIDRRPPFEAVLQALGLEDPEGLLAIGAPSDEYAQEADALGQWLRVGRPVTAEVLVEVWERFFGPDSGYMSYAQVLTLAMFAQNSWRSTWSQERALAVRLIAAALT